MNNNPSSLARMMLIGQVYCGFIIVLPLTIKLNASWLFPNADQSKLEYQLFGAMYIGLVLGGIALFPFYLRAIDCLHWNKIRHCSIFIFLLAFFPIFIAAQTDYARRALGKLATVNVTDKAPS